MNRHNYQGFFFFFFFFFFEKKGRGGGGDQGMFVLRWLLGNINKIIYAAVSAQDEVTHQGEEVLPLKIDIKIKTSSKHNC